jgi:hypothetical protein
MIFAIYVIRWPCNILEKFSGGLAKLSERPIEWIPVWVPSAILSEALAQKWHLWENECIDIP